ncbi:MAG TPA: alpha/beta hydrolase [Kiloniellales bacterium]|nr:alpha/beta hydrolase [Kiloniellales bacterium]
MNAIHRPSHVHLATVESPALSTSQTWQLRELKIAGGHRIEYVAVGDPDGLPVLLLHGYTDSWTSWQRVLPLLPAKVRAYAISQRGHGNSSRPGIGYQLGDFAEDAAAFLAALDIERALVVGHSMGAAVAERLAVHCPHRVAGLLLVGAFGDFAGNRAIRDLWEDAVSGLSDPIDPEFVRAFQESTIARELPPSYLATVVAESYKVPARVWRAALRGQMDSNNHQLRWRIACPTMLVWGDSDALVPRREQELLTQQIPQSMVRIFPGVGHAVQWEAPEGFAGLVQRFVEEISPSLRPLH